MLAPATFLVTLLTTANGVPQDGFPNWNERTILVLANRARADPAAALSKCAAADCPDTAAKCYSTPVPPLTYDFELNKSARFHSTNLVKSGSALSHPSPCEVVANIATLYPDKCDGSPSCACVGGSANCSCQTGVCGCQATGTCTGPFVRMQRFNPNGCAENIAAGYGSPEETFDGWLLEHCGSPAGTCGFTEPCVTASGAQDGTNGHRVNILNGGNTLLGVGVDVAGTKACFSGQWSTQDFGCTGGIIPKLVAGTHTPQLATHLTFYANWSDTAAPATAHVNVGGTCETMTVDRGKGGNATYLWTGTVPAGCNPYVFTFTDSQGNTVNLPQQGAYQAGDTCDPTKDWIATAPTPCGGGTGTSGLIGGNGSGGNGSGTGSGTGGDGDGGTNGGFLGGATAGKASGGCATGLGGADGLPLLLALGLLARRRR